MKPTDTGNKTGNHHSYTAKQIKHMNPQRNVCCKQPKSVVSSNAIISISAYTTTPNYSTWFCWKRRTKDL